MKHIASLVILFVFAVNAKAQNIWNTDTISAPANLENIYVRALGSDSLTTANVIFIKTELKAHRHLNHSEQAFILDGKAEMLLGNKWISVKKGDIIFIPKNTVHAVKTTSTIPLKVLAIQAPYADGTDRVWEK